LDAKATMQVDELRVKLDMLMNRLIKNPDVLNALLQVIEKLENNGETLFPKD